MPIVAPSLLAANFLDLQGACNMINKSEAEWLHLDVMDGVFVPNISFGMSVIEQVKKATTKFCDVHLMITHPENYAEAFKKAGADLLTVHYEACTHLHRNIQQIKSLGMQAGVAINPHTPVHLLSEILQDIDLVLIMSVNPGFGGQQFIPRSIEKIAQLKEMIRERKLSVKIEVDGGIGPANAKAIAKAGADILVAGSSVFSAPDPMEVIHVLKHIND